jgi:hypothetical protein
MPENIWLGIEIADSWRDGGQTWTGVMNLPPGYFIWRVTVDQTSESRLVLSK